jgi:deoxyribonuclease-4
MLFVESMGVMIFHLFIVLQQEIALFVKMGYPCQLIKRKMMLIGAHTSAAGGVFNALLEGKRIGATTIQLFTSNQKRWAGKPLTPEVIEKWNETLIETGLKEIMCHDSYLINLGAPNPETLEKSRKAFGEEIGRCKDLGITYLNFHPGAALKTDPHAFPNLSSSH